MENILTNAEVYDVSNDIRDEIDQNFSKLKSTNSIFELKFFISKGNSSK